MNVKEINNINGITSEYLGAGMNLVGGGLLFIFLFFFIITFRVRVHDEENSQKIKIGIKR